MRVPRCSSARSLIFFLAVLIGWTTAATAQDPPPAPDIPIPARAPELVAPDRMATANLKNAAVAPLTDLDILRQGIPPVLLAAITNPYQRPAPLNCNVLEREVDALETVLGADFDEPETPQSPSLTRKGGKIALALVHGAADLLLPYSGFIRTLSGAQRHDQQIVEAITAGSVRRGYLKGLGESLGCPRPARPVHFLRPPPPAQANGRGPRYPIQ